MDGVEVLAGAADIRVLATKGPIGFGTKTVKGKAYEKRLKTTSLHYCV